MAYGGVNNVSGWQAVLPLCVLAVERFWRRRIFGYAGRMDGGRSGMDVHANWSAKVEYLHDLGSVQMAAGVTLVYDGSLGGPPQA